MVEEKTRFNTLIGYVQSFAPGSGQQLSLVPPDNAASSDTAVVQDQILLFKALGGGWRNRSAAEGIPRSASGATRGNSTQAAAKR